jgi:uncharacterized protein YndB with AHSA1/START domain
MAIEPIRESIRVRVAPEVAFQRFTEEFGAWWPREFSWSQDVLEQIGMEPGEGGLLSELGPHGFRLDWGRITTWEAPRRLVFTWQITGKREPQPDPAKASEVRVHFEAEGRGTRVDVEHTAFERHGEGAREYRDALAGAWRYALERYVAYVNRVVGG